MRGGIFDLDGVLCHTDRYHCAAWKRLADRLGIPFDRRINDGLRGISRMESLERILSVSGSRGLCFTREQKRELAEEKNGYYVELLAGLTPEDVPEEITDTLLLMKRRGIRLAVGSSSKNAGLIMERTGLAALFDAVIDGNELTRSKPDPEVFLRAAEALGLPPSDCFVVEDAPAGIEAAMRGGFYSVAYGSAAGRADCTVEAFSDLLILTAEGGDERNDQMQKCL